jgi:hypothetical protein
MVNYCHAKAREGRARETRQPSPMVEEKRTVEGAPAMAEMEKRRGRSVLIHEEESRVGSRPWRERHCGGDSGAGGTRSRCYIGWVQAVGELNGGLEQSHSTHSDLLKKSNRFEWIRSKDILPMLQNFQIKYGFVAN